MFQIQIRIGSGSGVVGVGNSCVNASFHPADIYLESAITWKISSVRVVRLRRETAASVRPE